MCARQVNRSMFHPALRPGLPPLEQRTKDVFCRVSACTCSASAAAAAVLQQHAGKAGSGGDAPPALQQLNMPLVTWEPGVTADVAPDLLRAAPFVYVCDRLYNMSGEPGGFEVEERLPGRCHCKVSAACGIAPHGAVSFAPFVHMLALQGRAHSVHCTNGECASQVINRRDRAR